MTQVWGSPPGPPQNFAQASVKRGRDRRSDHIQKKGSDGSPESVYASAGAVVAIALRTKPDLRHLVQTRTLNVVPSPASMRTL